MQKELEFTLNEQMLSLLIHFNDLKQNLKLLEKQYTLDKNNKQLLLQIESTNEEMKRLRNRFIETLHLDDNHVVVPEEAHLLVAKGAALDSLNTKPISNEKLKSKI